MEPNDSSDASNRIPVPPQLLDLFANSVPGLASYFGLGFLLAWLWLGVANGFPLFRDGAVDMPCVIALFAGFSGCLLCIALVPGVPFLIRQRPTTIVFGVIAALGCMLLSLVSFGLVSVSVKVIASAAVGLGAAAILDYYGLSFSRLPPSSSVAAFVVAVGICFFAYFSVASVGYLLACILFSCLPLLALVFVFLDFQNVVAQTAPEHNQPRSFAKGYVQFITTSAIFVFTIGFTKGMEPQIDFGKSANISIIGFLVCAVVVLGFVLSKRSPFKILKTLYSITGVMLVLLVTVSPFFGNEDSTFNTVFNTNFLMLFMVIWLVLTFIAYKREVLPTQAFSLGFALASLGAAAGWVFGNLIHLYYGDSRFVWSVAMGFLVLAFFSVGFSSQSFSNLVASGKADKRRKAEKAASEPMANALAEHQLDAVAAVYNLSKREREVLVLLVSGHGGRYIADELTISYYTVRSHMRNIYEKLCVHNREELLEITHRFQA